MPITAPSSRGPFGFGHEPQRSHVPYSIFTHPGVLLAPLPRPCDKREYGPQVTALTMGGVQLCIRPAHGLRNSLISYARCYRLEAAGSATIFPPLEAESFN